MIVGNGAFFETRGGAGCSIAISFLTKKDFVQGGLKVFVEIIDEAVLRIFVVLPAALLTAGTAFPASAAAPDYSGHAETSGQRAFPWTR